ncbi:multidrug effflux MFS transporter [Agarivorans sp. MS3-6]|uniref:multidrug effflux MFS transporter n=1 Tax=Agarivorans sp. TSD2052 TaxID=2937286 RepID=UPI00200DEEF2|nr:multidrug effflux MFS transporter [Agarivorans sp. TSD2052]UPW18419.1 multidrug effflux MFS transporter [Agarivorans sp. TSD2052]
MRLSNPLPLFMLMVLFSPLAIDIFLPAIPQMAASFQVPVAWITQTIPVFLFAFGIGQLLVGPLADLYGRRPVALLGAVIYVVTSAIAALAASYEVLMLARLGQGIAASCLSVAAFAGVRDHFGTERSKSIFSYLNGVICIVPALAPLLGGVLTHWWSWSANFWFMVGFAVVVLLAMLVMLKETKPQDSQFSGRLYSLSRYGSVLKVSSFRFYSLLVMLGMAMIIAYVSQSPGRLMVDMQLSSGDYALWFGANALINIIAAFLAPQAIKCLGQTVGLWLGACLMGASAVALILAQEILHPLAFMAPVFVSSIGFCFLIAVGTGSALSPFGDKAGTASALLGFVQMTGSACLVGAFGVSGLTISEQLAALMALPFLLMALSLVNPKLNEKLA